MKELEASDVTVGFGYGILLLLTNAALAAQLWTDFCLLAFITFTATISLFFSVFSKQNKA